MVRPKNQHKYKQYEDRFNPTTQFETMFASVAKSSSSKRDSVKLSPPNPNQSQKKRERSGWERKDEKTQYNEQALAINSKSKVDKSSNGANKHRNYSETQHHQPPHQHQQQQQHSSNQKPTKTFIEVDDEKDTDDSEEFFQLIRDTVAEAVKVGIWVVS